MEEFEVGQSDTPVFRDGLTSDLTYVFLACKKSDTYNGVVIGVANNKLKFYPNAQFWGMNEKLLSDMGIYGLYNRQDYQGVSNISPVKTKALLERLRTQRGAQVVSDNDFDGLQELRYKV